jgi:hypothetical protein
MSEVSLEKVYTELMDMKKELALIKHILIPEETVSKEELEEINRIKKRMEKGERIRLEELLAKD